MRRLAERLVVYPRAVLVAVAIVSAAAVWACTRVGFDSSTERLLVRDGRGWQLLEETRAAFGGDETLFVLFRADDVLAPAALRTLHGLSTAVAAVPEVERTTSLTTLAWSWDAGGETVVRPVFTPDGRPEPGAPVAEMLKSPLVTGNLVSADRRVAAILATVAPHPEDPAFKGRLVSGIAAAVAAAAPDADVVLGGAPYAQVALRDAAARDLRRLGPVAFVIMGVILFVTYRTAHGVWLPLATVAISLLWTIAVAGVFGRSFSIVSSILPPLVLAVGTSYTMRVLSEFNLQQPRAPSRAAAVLATIEETGVTVVLCGLTTALGFAALVTSRVEVVRDLGFLATGGAVLTTVAALTIVPAVLMLLPDRAVAPRETGAEVDVARLLPRIYAFTERRRVALVAGALIAMLVGLAGLAFVVVDQNPYAWFPDTSAVAVSTGVIDSDLGGVTPLGVVLESPDGAYDPRLLASADALAAILRTEQDVGAVVSPADHLRVMDRALGGSGSIPASRALVAQYALLYEMGDGAALAPYLNENRGAARVAVRARHYSSSRLAALIDRIERRVGEVVRPPISAKITGTGLLRLETNDEFTRGIAQQLGLASLAITVLVAAALRSVRLGVLSVVPNVVPIIIIYGVLGWVDIPLNAATVTAGAAALGNSVDDTVQWLDRYRRRLKAAGDARRARREAIETVGTPMIASDVVLAAGFGVLCLSSFFPMVSLGLMGATAMALSLAANVFVLPALAAIGERAFR